MFTKQFSYYNNKLIKSYYLLFDKSKYKEHFISFISILLLYSLADHFFFYYCQSRWFDKIQHLIYLYIFLIFIILLSLHFFNTTIVKILLVLTISITISFFLSALIIFNKMPKTEESISVVASSDENTYDWKPFEQPDMPSTSLISQIKNKYNKDFTNYRNNFQVTNAECLYYYKHGKFPYNNNLLRPSYNNMLALDPQNKLSFQEWKDSYYKSAQENVPMRVLILRSTSGTTGYELQGIKEVDFANKLYQGKLSLDNITVVGCQSNGKPWIKESGVLNTSKSDTDIYDAINKEFDIEFIESSNAGCTKDRKLCTENNILACPFRFQDEDKNTRMSNVMAEYWNMDPTQTKQFDTGCYSNSSCQQQQNA